MKLNKLDFKSLGFRLWLYIVIFALLVIIIIWGAVVYMLNSNYESMRAKSVTTLAEDIVDENGSHKALNQAFFSDLSELAIDNDMVIMIEEESGITDMVNQNGTVTSFNSLIQQPLNTYTIERQAIKQALARNTGSRYVTMTNRGTSEYRMLSYGAFMDSSTESSRVLYIFAPLYPVSSTIAILKVMLIYVTIFAIILALILAMYISRKFTKPLKSMTESAVRLSNGEYGIDFEESNYTEIKELSDTLTYTSHELAKSDQLQKDIIANVSHDLRTPLTMVKSYAEMIKDISGDNPEKRNSHLDVIIEETDRLNLLVNDMFTLSTMQSKVASMNMSDFDLVAAAKEIYSSYEILQLQEGYTIEFNSELEEALVHADESRIKQVISNLFNNAVKYCGDDKFISINISKDGDSVKLSVTDHGQGIPEDQLENVWDRYYRVSSNYHRSNKGTGLGLSIVKEILNLHDAGYGVESVVGSGSTFWFTLRLI